MRQKIMIVLLPVIVTGLMSCRMTGFDTGAPLTLAKGGRSDYVIVQSAHPTEAEVFAAQELAEFFKRGTGAELPIIAENDFTGGKAIYLGHTKYAMGQGVDFSKLGREEWIIRSVGDQLILAGGRPRGTLYAVYEFLEKVMGIRFLDAHTTHIPRNAVFQVPAGLDIRAKPAFDRREIFGHGHELFQVRRKLNSFANAWRVIDAKYGYSVKYGSPYTTHTHYRYVEDFPEAFTNHPEYFALTDRGNRDPNRQVCMSHPDVRKIFAAKLREYIRRDRRAALDAGRGEDAFPQVYALVPNDGSSGKCFCKRCLALADKYGSYAGVVLEFINYLADDIAPDYPEIVLATGVYIYYRDIPSGIRPRANVMVSIAQLGAEFNTIPKRDTFRSMLHPLNAGPRREWEAWSRISPMIGVHDYWTAWQQSYQWPQAYVHGLAETLKFYHQCGLSYFIVEDALCGSRIHNFVDLQFYMATRLFQNPAQDAEQIIEEFMRLYYGPAAPDMRKLLVYIETRQEEEKGMLAAVPPASRAYFDAAFFIETDAILREAEARVAGDQNILANVRQERLALDETMLYLWEKLRKQAGEKWPFDRDAVVQRLAENYETAYKKYGGCSAEVKSSDQARLAYLRNMPPVPPQFEGKKIIDLCGPMLNLTYAGRIPKGTAEDPEAATGRTWRLAEHAWTAERQADHGRPPEFGLSDCVSDPKFSLKKVLTESEIPRDEKYHWHLIGRMQATPTMYFYAHHSWVFDMRLLPAFNAALPDQKFYDAYVSLKLEGLAYVPGSVKANAFSIDRIILVEADTDNAH